MVALASIVTSIEQHLGEPLSVIFGRVDAAGGLEASKLNVSKGAADAFRELCADALDSIRQCTPVEYTADAELERGELFLLDQAPDLAELDAFGELAARSANLRAEQPADLDLAVQLWAVVVGAKPADRVLFVRKTDPSIRYRAGRFLAVGRQQLEKLDEPAFSFAPGFDLVMRHRRWAAVLNQAGFERLFRDTGIIEQHVRTWVDSIGAQIPLAADSARSLIDVARTDSRTWRKLREIERRGHLRKIKLKDIEAYAAKVGLDPKAVVQGGKLVFDPKDRFSFLHLLNEDLYHGPLTDERFEAQRKASM